MADVEIPKLKLSEPSEVTWQMLKFCIAIFTPSPNLQLAQSSRDATARKLKPPVQYLYEPFQIKAVNAVDDRNSVKNCYISRIPCL